MIAEATYHPPAAGHLGVQTWSFERPVRALSSAAVGGGLARPSWLLNIGVPRSYDRTDLAAHAREVAATLGRSGEGIALFTAADVEQMHRRSCEGVVADATVGLSKPTWAADANGGWNVVEGSPADDPATQDRSGPPPATAGHGEPGTINVIVQLPVSLEPGAAVNAVITATEAKTQALLEAGVPGTGTASDAVVVVWPASGPSEPFAGPRSEWGARLAIAVRWAVAAGIGDG